MNKIAIIGCGGAGKSTLATRLAKTCNIPLYHLDALYWKPGWIAPDKQEWAALQTKLCAEPAWIMDGNYGGTLDIRLNAADTIVFLDFPGPICLWRVARRQIQYSRTHRPDMAPGCNERFDVRFVWWILRYNATRRPVILNKLKSLASKRIIVLSSQREIDAFANTAKAIG